MPPAKTLLALARFGLDKSEARLEHLPGGFINDTYLVVLKGMPSFVLQRINTDIFPGARQVMENLQMMLPFLQGPGYVALELEPTQEGIPWLETGEGELWRLFRYIPNSGTLEYTDNPSIGREAGRILGCFHQLVSKAEVKKLHIPLPRFHDLEWRAQQLEAACTSGIRERIKVAEHERMLSQKLIDFCRHLPFSEFPTRICHNDAKLNNILLDLASGKALCLIDLDTLMPGHLLYDFGDAARTLLNPVPESSRSAQEFRVDLSMFEAFVKGWRESGFTTAPEEARWLAHGVVLMPALHGIRALTDHFSGDQYYKTHFPGQNLVRAKNLLRFGEKVRKVLPKMEAVLRKHFN
ncbi:MAG: aminoglycoside phosphotransferase family protein [Robiginitalea sp.]